MTDLERPVVRDAPGAGAGWAGRDTDDALLADLVTTTIAINRTLRVRDAHLQPTVDAVVRVATAFTGFEAGLILVEAGRLEPQATTGNAPHELDLVQQRLGYGPCLEAAQSQIVVHVDDTRSEARWTPFGDAAAALGVASMLCIPLWVEEHVLGTVSLYSDRPAAFTERDRQIALLCATLAAVAVAEAQRGEQLRGALARRDVIGQAKGVLMARHKVTSEQAFAMLRQTSQDRNEKLFAVAEHVIETGILPQGDHPAARPGGNGR